MNRKSAYLQIIRKCNNECVFCSNPQFEKEITLAQVKREVAKLKAQGVNEVFLTGGEPTISRDLFAIIRYLRAQNIRPRMITNGVELSDNLLARKLKDSGLESLNISVHSHKAKIADKLSLRPGNFQKVLRGIRNVLNSGLPVHLNSTINSLNYRQLAGYVDFMSGIFPQIKHFVFNFLDPGKADGNLKSRAAENFWIVPRYAEIKGQLKKMVKMLKKHGKTFRIERVPLCCMRGFEENSTETRKLVKDQRYICSFVEKSRSNRLRIVTPVQLRVKVKKCKKCSLKDICVGVQQEYLNIHGVDDLVASRSSPQSIIEKIKKDRE